MMGYLLRRLLLAVPTVLLLSVISFTFISLAPGDVVTAMMGASDTATPAELAQERHRLGLDQPFPVRYLRWLNSAAHGNLGYSLLNHQQVRVLIADRIGATLLLGTTAVLLAAILGVVAGAIAAMRQYSVFDQVVSILSYAAYAVPNFFLGLLAIYVFSVLLRILPSSGASTPAAPFNLGDHITHLILPASALAVQFIGIYARQTRSAMLDVMRSDYVRTARSKGLHEWQVTLRHILRNSLLPVITVIGLNLPLLVGGAIVTEIVFNWPGMGTLTVNAIYGRDYPVVLGVVLVIGVGVVLANLAVDIAYSIVDPRIRYGEPG